MPRIGTRMLIGLRAWHYSYFCSYIYKPCLNSCHHILNLAYGSEQMMDYEPFLIADAVTSTGVQC